MERQARAGGRAGTECNGTARYLQSAEVVAQAELAKDIFENRKRIKIRIRLCQVWKAVCGTYGVACVKGGTKKKKINGRKNAAKIIRTSAGTRA